MEYQMPFAFLAVPENKTVAMTTELPLHTILDTSTNCNLYLFLLVGVFGCIVGLIGIFGNVLTIVVISRVTRGSITFHLLLILAVIDTIFLVGYIVTQSVPELIHYWNQDVFMDYATYALWAIFPLYSMASTASIWVTTLVTSYRYIIARRSLKHRRVCSLKSVNVQVALIIAVAVVLDIPRYFERLPSVVLDANSPILEPTDLWNNPTYQLVYRFIIMVLLRAALPIMITSVMVYKRMQLLDGWKKSRLIKLNKPDLPNGQERVSVVLIIMAIFFVICLIPSALYPATRLFFDSKEFNDAEHQCHHFYLYLYTSADFLATFYSAFNFFILYPSIPTFRRAVKQIICPIKDKRRTSTITQESIISSKRTRTLSTIM